MFHLLEVSSKTRVLLQLALPLLLSSGFASSQATVAADSLLIPHDEAFDITPTSPSLTILPFEVAGNSEERFFQFFMDLPPSGPGGVRSMAFRRRNYGWSGESQATFPSFSLDLEVRIGTASVSPPDIHMVRSRNVVSLSTVVASRRQTFAAVAWRSDGDYGWDWRIVFDQPVQLPYGSPCVVEFRMGNSSLPASQVAGIEIDYARPRVMPSSSPPIAESFGVSCISGGTSLWSFRLLPGRGVMIGGHGDIRLTGPATYGPVHREMFFGGLSASRMGALSLPFGLDNFGALGCQVYCSLDWQWPTIDDFSDRRVFWASADISLPDDPRLLGLDVYSQAVQMDPTANQLGVIFSNGVRTRVIPKIMTRMASTMWGSSGANGANYQGVIVGGPRILFETQ